jgi:uncharacterized protein YdeI (YjbR/CyaY-like superfamily)
VTELVELLVQDAEAWRAWLDSHHADHPGVWLVLHKKGGQTTTLTYPQALDEALCFGWIDGVRHKIDDTAYCNRFTPRRKGSSWSAVSIAKVAELTAAGKMRPAGVAAFEAREASPEAPDALPAGYEARLRADERAWADFMARSASYRRLAARWVMSAKREPTRERRLAQLIECSAAGRAIPPLAR